MSHTRKPENLVSLVNEMRKLPAETEWVEFKHNNDNPEEIGEYISALSNSAVLAGKAFAYMLWGIEDGTHDVVGTRFTPATAKKGGEELENWLLRLLTPRIAFRFLDVEVDGKRVVILAISRAFRHPVTFQGQEYIRVGSYKKKLKEHPEKERELWRALDDTPFEDLIAVENCSGEDVTQLLDYPAYFDLLKQPLPGSVDGILQALEADSAIRRNDAGGWDITNFGAMTLARKLEDFNGLSRKAVRVIQYKGKDKIETIREQVGKRGYAAGFERLISYVNGLLPTNEVVGQALRKTVPMYPELAVRELVANALIHQDFFVTGAGPTIEIFDGRMEITNPGKPLVDTERFLDSPPRSRNEVLASFLRRIGVCEERGSGIDKVVFETEFYQLPAPLFEAPGENTRAVLFAHRTLAEMDRDDRVRACYLHACLKFVNREYMTNATVRERFRIDAKNSAQASRLIKDAVDAEVVRPFDKEAAPKLMRYVPFWA